MESRQKIKVWTLLLFSMFILGCVKDRNFDLPQNICDKQLTSNATYADIKALYADETIQIQEDFIIDGYVVSSDEKGNFFSVLYFQNSPKNPTEGFQIVIDQRDSHLFYPVGSRIFVKLKGLYLGRSKDVYKIGGAFTSFGNISVGRLPTTVVGQHVWRSCDEIVKIEPTMVTIPDLSSDFTNTLVKLDGVEFASEDQGSSFAIAREETEKSLVDCEENEIELINSGYSDFYNELLPKGNGSVTGVLLRENNKYHLVIRKVSDLIFADERCDKSVSYESSNSVFISELADPENNAEARFLELYNSSDKAISLKGWRILRYSNKNTAAGSEIDLSGFTIQSNAAFTIAANGVEFESVYAQAPDLVAGTNSPADSNGDDNFELIDPFDVVIDVFGIVGEDGSNTNHEFEDGRAVRRKEIRQANAYYTFSEWQIFNDSGGAGTSNNPQIAPSDFSPGEH